MIDRAVNHFPSKLRQRRAIVQCTAAPKVLEARPQAIYSSEEDDAGACADAAKVELHVDHVRALQRESYVVVPNFLPSNFVRALQVRLLWGFERHCWGTRSSATNINHELISQGIPTF